MRKHARGWVSIGGGAMILLVSGTIRLRAQYSGSVTLTPSSPTQSWQTSLPPDEEAAFSVSIQDGGGYVLAESSAATPTGSAPEYFLWTGGGSGRSFSFSVVNTYWEDAWTEARVDCAWKPSGGGSGEGEPPPWIYGWGKGKAIAEEGEYYIEVDPEAACVCTGGSFDASSYRRENGTSEPAYSDWNVTPTNGISPAEAINVPTFHFDATQAGTFTVEGTYSKNPNLSDTATFYILSVGLNPTNAIVCVNSPENVSFDITSDSHVPFGIVWTLAPTNLPNGATIQSQSNDRITIAPGSVPTNYTITARADSFSIDCSASAVLSVLRISLEASKHLLTLMHDRDCNLEVKTEPATGISFDEFRIDIKRTNSTTWYVLSTNKTMTPWQANIAGNFHLRGMAKVGGTEFYSTNIVIENQSPSYAEIEADTKVRAATNAEWASTLADCTDDPNQRRERGFWIRINTISNIYEHTEVIVGPWAGPETNSTIILGSRPANIPPIPLPNSTGATYTVASFHTHTPLTYVATNRYRRVGPSRSDEIFDEAQDVTGLVYDYLGDEENLIWGGHPKNATAQIYPSGPQRRSTP